MSSTPPASNAGALLCGAPFPPRPRAIATFLSSADFLPGCQTVLHSAKRHLAPTPGGQYPPEFIVLLSSKVPLNEEIKESLLPAFCDRIVRVDHIPIAKDDNDEGEGTSAKPSHVQSWDENCGWTKLRLFELDCYDAILYLDADCLVVSDVGHLLCIEEQANDGDASCETRREGLLAAAPDIFPPDKFNAGVMVLRPSRAVFADMLSKLPGHCGNATEAACCSSYDGGDTGFLNSFYPGWYRDMPSYSRLPFGCNAQRFMHHCTYDKQPKYWDDAIDDIRIIHYSSSPKPWEKIAAKASNGVVDEPSYLDGTDANTIQMAKHGKLERMWLKDYKRSQQHLLHHHEEELQKQKQKQEQQKLHMASQQRNAPPKRRKATPPAAAASRATPPPARAKPQTTHSLVQKRYKELRKEGRSFKDAMADARAQYGMDKDDVGMDPSKAVGQMFGLM